MQQLLLVALWGLLSKDVLAVLFDLCGYFRDISSKNLDMEVLKRLEAHIPIILCHLDMIFSPSFCTITAHSVLHLAIQARIARPVLFRWMYIIERYLGSLKSHVRNKAHHEAVSALECVNFCSWYLEGFNLICNLFSRTTKDDNLIDTCNISKDFLCFLKWGSL